MQRFDSNDSLLPHPLTDVELRRKMIQVLASTLSACLLIIGIGWLTGCFESGPSMADIAKQQALEYYSKSHRNKHYKPRGMFRSKQNAVIVILCRNSDQEALVTTIRNFEQQFNKRHGYPYVLLNDQPFSNHLKVVVDRAVYGSSGAKVTYGQIPEEHWSYPSWINQTYAAERRQAMEKSGIIYGGSESYRHMCRYFSGFIHKHPLLQGYEYYWRVEPGVKFFCSIPFDPFQIMKEESKKYGFVINFGELPETIPTLWEATEEFMKTKSELIKSDNCFDYFKTPEGGYNHCHFWSNFEIASFSLFKSQGYKAYFDFLDKQGGFFYERWGDAPIHSLAVGMFLDKEEVIYFEDIGYKHAPFGHCPIDSNWRRDQNCICNPFHESDQTHSECQRRWNRFPDP